MPQDRVRKFTDENKELAAQLTDQMRALQRKQASTAKAAKKGTRANGSDFSSARGSEERNLSTAPQGGRGPRKNRDYDLENVSPNLIFLPLSFHDLLVVLVLVLFEKVGGPPRLSFEVRLGW